MSTKHTALVNIDSQKRPTSIISRRRGDCPSTTSLHVRDAEMLSLQKAALGLPWVTEMSVGQKPGRGSTA